MSIDYHFQIDEQFERIIQTIEVVFRYEIINNLDIDFIQSLLYIQIDMHNIVVVDIDYTFNELWYDFRMRDHSNLLIERSTKNLMRSYIIVTTSKSQLSRLIWLSNSITITSTFHSIKEENSQSIYLRFIMNTLFLISTTRKLSKQHVVEESCKFVYRLKLSFVMFIHFVVFVTQLLS